MGNPYAPKPPGSPPPAPRGPEPDRRARRAAEREQRLREHAHRTRDQPPPDPQTVREASRRVMVFALLLFGCLLLTAAPLPWRMGAIALAVATIVSGALVLRRLWQAGVRGMLVVAVSAGMGVSLTLGLGTLGVVPIWDIEMDRQECVSHAITRSALAQCTKAYEDAVTEFRDSLGAPGR